MNRGERAGQISTEYLILLGFLVFIILAVLGASLFYSSLARDRLTFRTLEEFSGKIIGTAEEVYYAGEGARITVTAYVPAGVTSIYLMAPTTSSSDKTLLMVSVSTSSGQQLTAYTSSVPLEGNFSSSEGVKRFVISAAPDRVLITEG